MSYLTFGADIKTVVIVNLDTTSKFTQAVQFLYSMAIMLSVPLQLFPAVRIMENGIFEHSGKANLRVKWQKNIFRFITVIFCAALSYVGAADLDKFVSFVGSFAWYVNAVLPFNPRSHGCSFAVFLCAMSTLLCYTTSRALAQGNRRWPTSRSWYSV